jgi:hypothetical protein
MKTTLVDLFKGKVKSDVLSDEEYNELHDYINRNMLSEAAQILLNKKDELQRIVNEQEQEVKVHYKFNAFAHEGAYAVFQAVTEIYGRLSLNTQNGPSGPRPPHLINVLLPEGDYIKVPWGEVAIPKTKGEGILNMSHDRDDNEFSISGTIKRKYIPQVEKITKLIQDKLDKDSIYKGRAVYMDLGAKNGDVRYNEPRFMNMKNVNSDNVVLGSKTRAQLNPILQRITQSKICIENGLDLKYGALLEGPYGTGKTLVAFMLAKIAVDNNWTFIYLEDCHDMGRALRIAEKYSKNETEGCVIFTEDIDQVLRGERDSEMQEILNVLDGGDTKGKPIISIFSTNHLELIDPTFLRGKRIGSIISMGALDEETSSLFLEQICKNKKGKSLIKESDFELAAKSLCGIVPAFAHEVIDASKVHMISRGDSQLTAQDIELSAESYKRQIEISACLKKDPNEHKLIKAVQIFGEALNGEYE